MKDTARHRTWTWTDGAARDSSAPESRLLERSEPRSGERVKTAQRASSARRSRATLLLLEESRRLRNSSLALRPFFVLTELTSSHAAIERILRSEKFHAILVRYGGEDSGGAEFCDHLLAYCPGAAKRTVLLLDQHEPAPRHAGFAQVQAVAAPDALLTLVRTVSRFGV